MLEKIKNCFTLKEFRSKYKKEETRLYYKVEEEDEIIEELLKLNDCYKCSKDGVRLECYFRNGKRAFSLFREVE